MALIAVAVVGCSNDASDALVEPVSGPSASLSTFSCDTTLRLQLRSFPFGPATKAFTGITLTYTAEAVRKADNSPVTLSVTPTVWKENFTLAYGRQLLIGAEYVSGHTILNTMSAQALNVATTPVEIKARTFDQSGTLDRAACGYFDIAVEPGAPNHAVIATTTGATKVPVDLTTDIRVSVRNERGSRLPQGSLTFNRVSGASAQVTPLSDSIFKITPQTQGTVTFAATMGSLTQTYNLDICAPSTQATSVTLNRPLPTVKAGGSAIATAVARNCVGNSLPVSWRSSDPSVATVSSNGTISGVYPGTTYITAFNGAVADSALLTVGMAASVISGSLAYDPGYPTPRARLTWTNVIGATYYEVYRTCRIAGQPASAWELTDYASTSEYTTYDYVIDYAGTIYPPEGSYFAYYVVPVGANGATGPGSDHAYFRWDSDAEPGC